MTKIDNDRVEDRITVMDDEKKRVIDLYDLNIVPPDVGIFDAPTRCYELNKQWAKIIMGAVSAQLTSVAAWRDAQHEGYSGIQSVMEFLRGSDCPECTIEQLLEDPVFFEQYQEVVFGDIFTGTNSHNIDLNDLYDGTPQSVGPLIPTAAPNARQDSALCFAINSFVHLYSSYKVCIIQSKNFLQIAWTELQSAIHTTYGIIEAGDTALFNFLPDVYGCFVSDAAAITALSDSAAIEEVVCSLFDYLDTLIMSQTNFDAAIANAVATLVGAAQDIACIMSNDNNLDVYLNFLEIYNLALERQLNGDDLPCPCLSIDAYRLTANFASGMDGFILLLGTPVASGIQSVSSGGLKIVQVYIDFVSQITNLVGMQFTVEHTGTLMGLTARASNNPPNFPFASQFWSGSISATGSDHIPCNISITTVPSARSIFLQLSSADVPTNNLILKKIELTVLDPHTGFVEVHAIDCYT